MENGAYRYALEMSTPLGIRHGELELTVLDDLLNGFLTMFTRTLSICNGRCTGSKIYFEGDMNNFLKSIHYQATGSVTKNKISLDIATDQGKYETIGILTDARRK